MKRRQFLKKSLIGGSIIITGAGYFWLKSGDGPESLHLQKTIEEIKGLKSQRLISTGIWSPSQVISHLAQSIEYSMIGYPQHKSDFFKNTVGKAAFSVFVSRGEMMHNLSEAIPGSPPSKDNNQDLALNRLIQTLIQFRDYSKELKPHFAYGELNKQEYTYAHIMHIKNHFEELKIDA